MASLAAQRGQIGTTKATEKPQKCTLETRVESVAFLWLFWGFSVPFYHVFPRKKVYIWCEEPFTRSTLSISMTETEKEKNGDQNRRPRYPSFPQLNTSQTITSFSTLGNGQLPRPPPSETPLIKSLYIDNRIRT